MVTNDQLARMADEAGARRERAACAVLRQDIRREAEARIAALEAENERLAAELVDAMDGRSNLERQRDSLLRASEEAKAALQIAPCLCSGGFCCSRCKALLALPG